MSAAYSTTESATIRPSIELIPVPEEEDDVDGISVISQAFDPITWTLDSVSRRLSAFVAIDNATLGNPGFDVEIEPILVNLCRRWRVTIWDEARDAIECVCRTRSDALYQTAIHFAQLFA